MRRRYVYIVNSGGNDSQHAILVTTSLRKAMSAAIPHVCRNIDFNPFYRRCCFRGREAALDKLKRLLPKSVIGVSKFFPESHRSFSVLWMTQDMDAWSATSIIKVPVETEFNVYR